MILGLEDIPGGTPFVAFLIWLALTGLFYLVCFMAVLNVLDDLTRNSLLKIPAMLGAAIPAAGLMTVFNYKPYLLGALILFANFYRVRNKILNTPKKWGEVKLNSTLFYFASYAYIFLLVAMAFLIPAMDFSASS